MRCLFAVFTLLAFVACSTREHATGEVDPWSDERLWPVLDAQDHRDTERLCAFLTDSSTTLRAAAALAFASVQDTSAAPCLIRALSDTSRAVRMNAALALGLVADSASLVALNEASHLEKDPATAQVLFAAGFRAELALRKHDSTWLISFLESGTQDVRLRAAQSLARLPKEELVPAANDILHAVGVERDPNVRMFLVGALKSNATPVVTGKLKELALTDSLPMIRIAAMRALGATKDTANASFLLDRLNDPDIGVQQTALEQLQRMEGPLNGDAIWKVAQAHADTTIKLSLGAMAMQHGDATVSNSARILLEDLVRGTKSPYFSDKLIPARIASSKALLVTLDEFLYFLGSKEHPVFRQACYQGALTIVRQRMASTRYASRKAQYAELGAVLDTAIRSGDPGLIASVAETLDGEEPEIIRVLFGSVLEMKTLAPLHPIRDLETRILIERVIAKRDGLPAPAHSAPPFNHPIDLARLGKLKQGQEYRITTSKGEIVLALEPEVAPGSCVAFDSLVTAGYYNDKTFHRVIPNFVAQGGCPRGDGYGGMPWTLRTEIGPEGFVEGAVGLASAGHDTESCQFFIMLAAAPHLDGRYTRFAHVVRGMDVAQRLQVGDLMTRVERLP